MLSVGRGPDTPLALALSFYDSPTQFHSTQLCRTGGSDLPELGQPSPSDSVVLPSMNVLRGSLCSVFSFMQAP